MTNQQIIIVGFMGSGKTTVAHELGRQLNYLVIDLDESISSNEGRSAAEIIQREGENSFRRIETQMLERVLTQNSPIVIATGGGAWTIAENRRLIAERKARAVWLDAPFELCWNRIEDKRELRPLAPSMQAAEKLYRERRSVYELADMRISVAENDSAEEIASRSIGRLKTIVSSETEDKTRV
jgi:shikimate kinase